MSRAIKGTAAAAALLLLANAAAGAERHMKSPREVQAAGAMKAGPRARLGAQHDYRSVAGFTARVDDPLYAFAAEPPVAPPQRPVITQFPMPNTVWW